MIVNRADLADLPANGDKFVKASLVDQIAGVVLAVPGEIRRERVGIRPDFAFRNSRSCSVSSKAASGNLRSSADEILDGDCF